MPEWQSAASALLVAIGVRHCNDVMTVLLDKLQPGVLPHFFVVQTLANLATANGKYVPYMCRVFCVFFVCNIGFRGFGGGLCMCCLQFLLFFVDFIIILNISFYYCWTICTMNTMSGMNT